MTTKADFDALIDRLNTATSKAAAILKDLRDKLAAGGLTADEEKAVQDKLSAVADALDAMAADPTDPVPVPVPEPEPTPQPEQPPTP